MAWHNEAAIEKNANIKLSDMVLKGIERGSCDGTYAIGLAPLC